MFEFIAVIYAAISLVCACLFVSFYHQMCVPARVTFGLFGSPFLLLGSAFFSPFLLVFYITKWITKNLGTED